MAKEKKKRAEKYDTKLAINGTFADVIKASVITNKKNMNNSALDEIIEAMGKREKDGGKVTKVVLSSYFDNRIINEQGSSANGMEINGVPVTVKDGQGNNMYFEMEP